MADDNGAGAVAHLDRRGTLMRSWIEDTDEQVSDPSPDDLQRFVASGRPFWLDIEGPTDDVIDRLASTIGLHPLAVEDSKEFGQRGKLERYGDVAMIVGFDIEDGQAFEVHTYYTPSFLITLRRDTSTTFDTMHRTGSIRPLLGGDPIRLLHHLTSQLHGQARTAIEEMDDRLDQLEEQVLLDPTDEQLIEIASVKQRATILRRTLTPGRDIAARAATVRELPGVTDDSMLYLADISDELHLVVADLGAISDRCLGLLTLHSSLTSNRQGAASKQLAAVATVFLPITFVVGFFGMNFAALVNHIDGWLPFVLLGIGLNVACVMVTFLWLGRRGWR